MGRRRRGLLLGGGGDWGGPGGFLLARPGGLDFFRFESNRWIFLHVEEVGTAQIVVAHFDAGVDGSGVNGGLYLAPGGIGVVDRGGAADFGEGSANGGDSEMAHRELGRRMHGINLPSVLCRGGERGCRDE